MSAGFRWHRPLLLFAGLVLLTILATPPSLRAQSLGVSVGLARSDYRELASPVALGLHARIPLVGWLHARGDLRRYSDEERWRRSTCQGLVAPDTPCPDDAFRGEFTMTAVGVGLVVVAPLPAGVEFEAGIQHSVTRVDGVWRGRESDVTVGRAPDRREAGWSYLAAVSYALTPRVSLTAGGRLESPEIQACVADGYSGFCDQHNVTSLEVGVSLRR